MAICSITDNADNVGHNDFEFNCKNASNIAADFVKLFIEECKNYFGSVKGLILQTKTKNAAFNCNAVRDSVKVRKAPISFCKFVCNNAHFILLLFLWGLNMQADDKNAFDKMNNKIPHRL